MESSGSISTGVFSGKSFVLHQSNQETMESSESIHSVPEGFTPDDSLLSLDESHFNLVPASTSAPDVAVDSKVNHDGSDVPQAPPLLPPSVEPETTAVTGSTSAELMNYIKPVFEFLIQNIPKLQSKTEWNSAVRLALMKVPDTVKNLMGLPLEKQALNAQISEHVDVFFDLLYCRFVLLWLSVHFVMECMHVPYNVMMYVAIAFGAFSLIYTYCIPNGTSNSRQAKMPSPIKWTPIPTNLTSLIISHFKHPYLARMDYFILATSWWWIFCHGPTFVFWIGLPFLLVMVKHYPQLYPCIFFFILSYFLVPVPEGVTVPNTSKGVGDGEAYVNNGHVLLYNFTEDALLHILQTICCHFVVPFFTILMHPRDTILKSTLIVSIICGFIASYIGYESFFTIILGTWSTLLVMLINEDYYFRLIALPSVEEIGRVFSYLDVELKSHDFFFWIVGYGVSIGFTSNSEPSILLFLACFFWVIGTSLDHFKGRDQLPTPNNLSLQPPVSTETETETNSELSQSLYYHKQAMGFLLILVIGGMFPSQLGYGVILSFFTMYWGVEAVKFVVSFLIQIAWYVTKSCL